MTTCSHSPIILKCKLCWDKTPSFKRSELWGDFKAAWMEKPKCGQVPMSQEKQEMVRRIKLPCFHRGDHIGNEKIGCGSCNIYICEVYGECTVTPGSQGRMSCVKCDSYKTEIE